VSVRWLAFFIERMLFIIVLLLMAWPALAQQRVFDIAIISDGPSDRLRSRQETYVSELLTLTEGEFEVRVRHFQGDWSSASIKRIFDEVYADAEIDLLMATGFISNQTGAMRSNFPKPTFLPVLLDPKMLVSLPVNDTSGITNLNYLTVYADFAEDLDALTEVAPFDKLVLIMDEELSAVIAPLKSQSNDTSAKRGIELLEVTHDGVNHDLFDRIPVGTNALFVAGLPRLPAEKFTRLIEQINTAGIPSYSFVGIADVERGLLMTSSESRDIARQARLNALNMQAVMLGARAEDQPVSASSKKRFTINMATARELGISPTFDVLNSSTLLHERPTATGQLFGLTEVAVEAINQNQDLLAQRYGVDAGFEDIDIAQSALFPQIDFGASSDVFKVSPAVELGFSPERTTDIGANLQQLIYSDPVYANIEIQRQLQLNRESVLREVQLDIIQAATSAYYVVLNAREQLGVEENNLDVTRRNLELARDRVELGSSSAADVYRWMAEEARARIRVIDAKRAVNQGWNRLNRLLHRPQFERLALKQATLNEPFVISQADFDQMISNPADYARFSNFAIDLGLARAPEIEQATAQIDAKKRELVSEKRSFWVPDVSVGGTYSSNLARTQTPGALPSGEGLDDWNFGIQASIPIFTGGQRGSAVTRAELELRQLEVLRTSASEKIEEEIRIQLHEAQAAYGTIDLTRAAADASEKNYQLVADAYARGTVSIIQLLDAQEASLEANAASISSVYQFLITIMAMQRAMGGYDYLMTEQEKIALANSLRQYMTGSAQ